MTWGDKASTRIRPRARPCGSPLKRPSLPDPRSPAPGRQGQGRFLGDPRRSPRIEHQPDRATCPRNRRRLICSRPMLRAQTAAGSPTTARVHLRHSWPRPERPATGKPAIQTPWRDAAASPGYDRGPRTGQNPAWPASPTVAGADGPCAQATAAWLGFTGTGGPLCSCSSARPAPQDPSGRSPGPRRSRCSADRRLPPRSSCAACR